MCKYGFVRQECGIEQRTVLYGWHQMTRKLKNAIQLVFVGLEIRLYQIQGRDVSLLVHKWLSAMGGLADIHVYVCMQTHTHTNAQYETVF